MFMKVVSMVLPASTIFMLPVFSLPEKSILSQSKSTLNEPSLGQEQEDFLN